MEDTAHGQKQNLERYRIFNMKAKQEKTGAKDIYGTDILLGDRVRLTNNSFDKNCSQEYTVHKRKDNFGFDSYVLISELGEVCKWTITTSLVIMSRPDYNVSDAKASDKEEVLSAGDVAFREHMAKKEKARNKERIEEIALKLLVAYISTPDGSNRSYNNSVSKAYALAEIFVEYGEKQ